MALTRRIVLAKRPDGLPTPDCFALDDEPLGPVRENEVRVAVEVLSIDAFIRTMLEERSFHGAVPIGGVVSAFGVGRVVASEAPGLLVGDAVVGPVGAQTVATLPSTFVEQVDATRVPLRAHLGALGLTTGLTAYFGMRSVGSPRAGETVVVSGAAGAVGSLAGQIAKLDGARVIGIAGGPDKARFLVDDLGFDAAIDYKGEAVAPRLDELASSGIDVYFDNVGGELLDVVLDRIREGARVVVCGAISQYQGDMSRGVRGPASYLRLAERNARMEGFTVDRFRERFPEAVAQLTAWLESGALLMREDVRSGIEAFPDALIALCSGGNTGKLLVEVA